MKINKYWLLPLTILACFMWSTAFVGIKIGFRYMNSPFNFAGMRFLIAGLMLVPFSWKKGFYEQIKANKKLIMYVTLFQTFIGYALYYTAMTFVEGAVASIVIGTGPLISAVLSHLMMENDKMTKKKMIALFVGLVGIIIIIISTKPTTKLGLMELLGIILLLFNTILGALVNIIVAKDKRKINPVFLSSNQMIWGGIMLLILGFFAEGKQNWALPIEFYISLIWLAVVSAVAISIWFVLLQQPEVKVSELNMWKFIIPLFGAVLAWIILPEETPDISSLIGMFLILSSLILYNKKNKEA